MKLTVKSLRLATLPLHTKDPFSVLKCTDLLGAKILALPTKKQPQINQPGYFVLSFIDGFLGKLSASTRAAFALSASPPPIIP